ncbi:MAG TPA: alpha/beta hydrolase [Acidimicrobiales bacterium]|nr:alpha/beta hydrolase [Acidimicrobiales bacterium]
MTDFTMSVPGAEVFVRDSGGAALPALVVFNGARCNTEMWTPVMDDLTPHFRVIRHDLRGTGRSRAADGAELGLARFADDAALILSHLELSSATVWGMAMGARVAAAFASRHARLTALVALYDASLEAPDPDAQRAGAERAKRRREELGIPELERDRAWFSNDDPDGLRRVLASVYKNPDHGELVSAITAPVLVATGEYDPNLEPSRRLAAALPGAEMTVLDATGHGSVMQRPGLCAAVLLDFARRHGLLG